MMNDLLLEPPHRCPSCHASALREWRELTEEQQEVVRHLPGTALYMIAERIARHRWCPVCWHEETGRAEHFA